jgi:hypothetical protein
MKPGFGRAFLYPVIANIARDFVMNPQQSPGKPFATVRRTKSAHFPP